MNNWDELKYRYASSMGNSYALPTYFSSLWEAQRHKDEADRILHGLPGHVSMRLETLVDEEWVSL